MGSLFVDILVDAWKNGNTTSFERSQQVFAAAGVDQYGNPVELTAPQWSTAGGGTLAPSGSSCTYTGTTVGSSQIRCKQAGTSIEDKATVVVPNAGGTIPSAG